MALNTLITFTFPNEASYLEKSWFKGDLDGDPLAWKDGLYNLEPIPISVNNIFFTPSSQLSWYVPIGTLGEKTRITAPVSFTIAGAEQLNSTGDWNPYFASSLAGGTITIPDGVTVQGVLILTSLIGRNDMAGVLGKYKYKSDVGTDYVIVMDKSNADTIGNEAAAADAIAAKPGALTLRYVLAQQTDNAKVRRKIVVGDVNNTKYKNGGTISLETIGGAKDFKITGRVGEKFSF